MGSLLGFRPPHFSEEEAWLPDWLQHSTIRDAAAAFEVGHLQQSISTGEKRNLSNDDTCKSLHLFLSGEDNSPMNFTSCSSNPDVQYRLHLSSIEESQFTLNPTLSKIQADKSEFNQALSSQQPEAKDIPEKDEVYMVPSQEKSNLQTTGPKSPSFKEVNPKVDTKCRKTDIRDAIELAVAASEALTIHKILKDERLIASSVLEAAIRVKNARLENSGENFGDSIEESNDVDFDFLSDLDHLAMAEAYEDVGLTVTGHDDLSGYGSISHVNDSFASESYKSNAKHKCNEHEGLDVDSGSFSAKKHDQVNYADISLKATHKEHVDYELLGTENADLACDVDPVFNCSVKQTDFCATKVGLQREEFSTGEPTSSQTILRSNEREDKMKNFVPDRFQSRWFGGWTSKNEGSIPPATNDRYKRSVPELFANETSYLSESADIAPDMSSCMQRQDKDKTVSQTSVAPQFAYEKANNDENLVTDDVAASPNASPMDPLCSVVPCSYSSDSVISHNSNHPVNLEKHLDSTVQPNLENLEVDGKKSPTVHRQVASLKTYSMLYPRCDPYLDKEHNRGGSSSAEPNETAKVDNELASLKTYSLLYPRHDPYLHKEHNRCGSSSVEPNETAKVDVELTTQRGNEMTRNVDSIVPRRKRVHFSDAEISFRQAKKFKKIPQTRLKDPAVASRRLTRSKNRPRGKDNKTLLQDLKFLLTGFSIKKHKQIKNLIQKNGGIVYDDIPSAPTPRKKRGSNLPLILCPKKLLTTKFLYGCAVNAAILKVTWLFDSIDEGLILPHLKYKVVLNDAASENHKAENPACYINRLIFDDVAIMLHGKPDFCSKMAKVIKHGGGSVFKTFHWLVKSLYSKKVSLGVIVMEDENGISRQLKQCAFEQKVPMMPFSWIINSLYAGRLVHSSQLKLPDHLINVEVSQEI
ncbi:hypothetical protein QVD17_17429 [Tagetes erecta]|uniref:BRCT domain-containing protein n=1 Tax=Tagetes erecta TaxID=13708 RepID=A0AAD8KWP6_TARER|nr:hypothetical protein QVD17_17429 [Tagetes erecta]